MRTSRPPASRREGQARSAFTNILETLLASTSGAIGAVLCDEEGEAVDHAGKLRAYDVKLAAAHWQIVLRHAQEATALGRMTQISVQAAGCGYVVRELFGGYVLVMVCPLGVEQSVSSRALRQVEIELREEAGFPADGESGPRWCRVRVARDGSSAPAAIWRDGADLELVEMVRVLPGLPEFARGYEVQTLQGTTLTLIRERDGRWYAAE